MRFAPSLFVNLHNTRLVDFSFHITQRLELSIVSDEGYPPLHQMRWKVNVDVIKDEVGPAMARQEFIDWHLEYEPGQTYALLQINQMGETYRSWGIYTKEDLQKGTPTVVIMATHYSRDILNVAMFEDLDSESRGDETVLAWLRMHWKTDVEVLPLENAPARADEMVAKTRLEYDYCIRAIKAKQDEGTAFEDFVRLHETYKGEISFRTLQRWMGKFGLSWK